MEQQQKLKSLKHRVRRSRRDSSTEALRTPGTDRFQARENPNYGVRGNPEEEKVVVETTRIVAHPEVLDRLTSIFVDRSGRIDLPALKNCILNAQQDQEEKTSSAPNENAAHTGKKQRKHHRKRHRCRRHHKSSQRVAEKPVVEEESTVESEIVVDVPKGVLEREGRYSENQGELGSPSEGLESPTVDDEPSDMQMLEEQAHAEELLEEEPEKDLPEYMALWELPPLKDTKQTELRDAELVDGAKEISSSSDIWITNMDKSLSEPPPEGFKFSHPLVMPYAKKSMELDQDLWNKHFILVPGQISDKDFWAAYVWQVELMKARVSQRYQGPFGVNDRAVLYSPISTHPVVKRVIQSELSKAETSASSADEPFDPHFAEIVKENGLSGVQYLFRKHGATSAQKALELTDEALADIGFESPETRSAFRALLQVDENQEAERADSTKNDEGNDTNLNKRNLELDERVKELLDAYEFQEIEGDLLSFGATSLEKILSLTNEQFAALGINTTAKVESFKRSVVRFMGDDNEDLEEGSEVLDQGVLDLLAAYGFQKIQPELKEMGATSLERMLGLTNNQFHTLGINTIDKIASFKRSIQKFIDAQDGGDDNPVGDENSVEAAHELDDDVNELLETYGFESLKTDLVELDVASLDDLLKLDDAAYSRLGFNTLEKIQKFRRSVVLFGGEASDEMIEPGDHSEKVHIPVEKDVLDAIRAFGLEQIKTKLQKHSLGSSEAVLGADNEKLLAVGFETEEQIEKVKKELKKKGSSAEEDITESKPVNAAPWELPPLIDKELSRKRNGFMFQSAVRMSSTRDIWRHAPGSTRLANPPPRGFKFSLPMVLPFANVGMELDPQLRNARFELIPSQLSERDFWMIYFWEIEILKLKCEDEFPAGGLARSDDDQKRIYCSITRPPMIKKIIAEEYEMRKQRTVDKDVQTPGDVELLELKAKSGPKDDSGDVEEAGEDSEDQRETESEATDDEILSTYAAPWEMPPLSTERINKKRDKLVKDRALELSQARDVWKTTDDGQLECPPPQDFCFSVDLAMPHINVAMEEDENLRNARFNLVPKVLSEHSFWAAYFWEVEQIKLQVTDHMQTTNHEEMLADLAFAKFKKNLKTKRPEQIEKPTKIYESCTSAAKVRGVVLREHVRRKAEKHNSSEETISQFRDVVNTVVERKKLLKRVSFSFDSDNSSVERSSPSPETIPRSALKVATTDLPVEDTSTNHDAKGSESTTAELQADGLKERNETKKIAEAADRPSDAAATGIHRKGPGNETGPDRVETIEEIMEEETEVVDIIDVTEETRVVKRTFVKVAKFFIPPVLLIPIVVVLRLCLGVLWAMKLIVIEFVLGSKNLAVKCLKSVWSFHKFVLRKTFLGVKYWIFCVWKFARFIARKILAFVSAIKQVNVMLISRTVRGSALVIGRSSSATKTFFVRLKEFSLQPLAYIAIAIKETVFLPVTIGRKVVKRSSITTSYLRKNRDDTLDILVAILGLGLLFLICTGVLFPFIHDFFTGARVPSIEFEPIEFPGWNLPTLYIPMVDFKKKETFFNSLVSYFV